LRGTHNRGVRFTLHHGYAPVIADVMLSLNDNEGSKQEEKKMDKFRLRRISLASGIGVSVIAGFFSWEYIFPVLIVLGLGSGFLNVTIKEVQPFLVASVSLAIISACGTALITALPIVGPPIGRICIALLAFVVPATIIVALKSLYTIASD